MPESLHVVGAVIVEQGRCLVAQRGPAMTLAGKWEFPGGKVEPREPPRAALAREIKEELGLDIEVTDWIGRGEANELGRAVALDVYAASVVGGTMHLREHSHTRWVESAVLGSLDWATADVPVIPAVRSFMRAHDATELAWPLSIVSADWGKSARKRAVWVARQAANSWTIAREQRNLADDWDLHAVLRLGRSLDAGGYGPVLIGIDVVLGLPFAFTRAAEVDGFLDGLRWLHVNESLTQTSTAPDAWGLERPFFRVGQGTGGLSRFVARAGGPGMLMRQIDRRTGAKTVFAVSGIPGTVGSGSRSLWSELVPLLDKSERDFGIWPFEGSLRRLLERGRLTLGETYPRAAYAIALSDELPAKLRPIAKTKRPARVVAVTELSRAPWISRGSVELRDRQYAEDNEDDFDAMMTAAAIVRLCLEKVPLSSVPLDPVAEGGILTTNMIVPPFSV